MGTHIIGGEMYYECLGGNRYKVTMKIYRDCYNGQPGFDNPALIAAFDSAGNLVKTMAIRRGGITDIQVNVPNPCLIPPPNVCVEEGIYSDTIKLPYIKGGYTLAYQRCCRNQTVLNLSNPGFQGATFTVNIADSAIFGCNSSPQFKDFPPIVICEGDPLMFDHSAMDPDGDSLVYGLCAAFQGASQNDPRPLNPSPPPYTPVLYGSGYSKSYPMNANPKIAIDPQTGILTGKPTSMGQFAVGVCVKEYRNGVLINEHRRDFQFNVANCEPLVEAKILPNSDTIITHCDSYKVEFDNYSRGANTYLWDFGVQGTKSDTSDLEFPSFTYPDTGLYKVTLIANPRFPCADTNYIWVKVFPFLIVNFSAEDGCPGALIHFFDSTVSTVSPITSRMWHFNNGRVDTGIAPIIKYSSGGQYTVKLFVENEAGCKEYATRKVVIHDNPVADFTFDAACIFQPIELINTSTIKSDSITKYQWQTAGGITFDSARSITYTPTDSGNYPITLIAISEWGCRDTVVKTISIRPKPTAVAWGDTIVCQYEPVQLYGSGSIYYAWGPLAEVDSPNAQNTIARPSKTTEFVLTVADDCYYDTDTVNVEVFPISRVTARPDTSIFYGESVWLYANSQQALLYEWSPNVSLDDSSAQKTIAQPPATTVYFVTIRDQYGCEASDEAIIYVRPICDKLYWPSAFSPNGDGVNDLFVPKDYGQNALDEMRIYNRWGELLYRTQDFESGWDGTYNGVDQEIGTYTYIIEGTCEGTPVRFKGNVTLLR